MLKQQTMASMNYLLSNHYNYIKAA